MSEETPEEYADRHDRYGNAMRGPLTADERIVKRAYDMLAESGILRRPSRGLAMPFGVPEPDSWRWRVSIDVRQALWRRMAELARVGMTGPAVSVEDRLFGIELTMDGTLPPNSILLEAADRLHEVLR